MTRILSELPADARGCVALNDLGYMALHGNFPILDLWGLGSQDVTELIIANGKCWTRSAHETLFKRHDVRYVVVYEEWMSLRLMPRGTVDVARMTLADNLVCGFDTVVFRATSPGDADRLERHLRSCADRLPPRVTMTFCPWRDPSAEETCGGLPQGL